MPNRKDYSKEPFAKCITCEDRKIVCRGIDTSDLPLETWRSFMRAVKDYEGDTYAEISLRTNPQIAARTIEKKLAPGGDGQDLMRETRRAIENAILGTVPFRCYKEFIAATSDGAKTSASAEAEVERLCKNIELIHEAYQKELATVRAEAQAKIDYLRAESADKSKIISRLLEK